MSRPIRLPHGDKRPGGAIARSIIPNVALESVKTCVAANPIYRPFRSNTNSHERTAVQENQTHETKEREIRVPVDAESPNSSNENTAAQEDQKNGSKECDAPPVALAAQSPNSTNSVLVFSSPPGGVVDANGPMSKSFPLSSLPITPSGGSVLTTPGDLLTLNGSSAFARIPIGTSGQVLTANGAGTAATWQNAASSAGAHAFYSILQNADTTVTTGIAMCGFGGNFSITPIRSGNIAVSFSGYITPSSGPGTNLYAYYGTGDPPAYNASVPGSAVSLYTPGSQLVTNAGINSPFGITFLALGLTVGTFYWFDLAYSNAIGNGGIVDNLFTAVEF